MTCEVVECLKAELRYPILPKPCRITFQASMASSDMAKHLADAEHTATIGKIATNDLAESPFARLTQQLQSFGRVLGIHASGIAHAHARFNGDFHRDLKDNSKDGKCIRLNPEMRESLLRYHLRRELNSITSVKQSV